MHPPRCKEKVTWEFVRGGVLSCHPCDSVIRYCTYNRGREGSYHKYHICIYTPSLVVEAGHVGNTSFSPISVAPTSNGPYLGILGTNLISLPITLAHLEKSKTICSALGFSIPPLSPLYYIPVYVLVGLASVGDDAVKQASHCVS